MKAVKRPKKVAVLGFDCGVPKRLEALVAEGALPNFKKVIEGGSYLTEGYNLPTVTPPSWATIATGSWPRTHGVEDYFYYIEGTELDNKKVGQSFGSKIVKSELIWDAWDKVGHKCIVVNYPVSWPSKMKNGIMAGGDGLTVSEFNSDTIGFGHVEALCSDIIVSSDFYPNSIRGEFIEAEEWKNLLENMEEPLEMEIRMTFQDAKFPLEPQIWYLLVWESRGDGYDQLALCPEKDYKKAFFTIGVGEWSQITKHQFVIGDDKRIEEGYFACKLMELSDDADDFKLYISAISGTTGFIDPPQAAESIDFSKSMAATSIGLINYMLNCIDQKTVMELAEYHTNHLINVTTSLLKSNPDWDLLYLHSHPIDFFYHGWMSDMASKDEEVRKNAFALEKRIYQHEDRLLGKLMEHFDDETLVVLVSDHGATPMGPIFNTASALSEAGLCKYTPIEAGTNKHDLFEELEGTNYNLDHSQSKAVPHRYMFVYVNLKDKYPGGIVLKEDYEIVRKQIIDALLDYRHPDTGERPVIMALTKEDARVLGMGGEQAGDVVYVLKPEYMAEHGYGLPTGECGFGTLKNILIFNGPNIKTGYRYERPRWLVDIVPTLCHLTGNPIPMDAEGGPIYQIMEDPNLCFKK